MSSAYETLLFHDAAKERLDYVAEQAAAELVQKHGWGRTAGDLPRSIGLRVPRSSRSWGERVSIAVEEKSIRIVSSSSFPLQAFGFAKNRKNAERVRETLQRLISEGTAGPGV